MDWSGVYYCDVFISCLDSHSDGTHSLQSIHCWDTDAVTHFSKSDEETNSSTSRTARGWVHSVFFYTMFFLQFFSIVYTQILVLETQWPQHVTHSPTPWTNSAKLQAQFLLYTQIAVLKHTFFKTLHTILCFWHNFHAENILFSQGTHCHSNMHTDSSQGQTPVTQFYN